MPEGIGDHDQTRGRIYSAGWRDAWVVRIVFLIGAPLIVADADWLFGPPWQSGGALGGYTIMLGLLLVFWVVMESQRALWVEISTTGVRIGYLFSSTEIAWGVLKVGPGVWPFEGRSLSNPQAPG